MKRACCGLLVLALAGCAGAHEGWESNGDVGFAAAQARCAALGPESVPWEVCVNGFGWRRTIGARHEGGYDLLEVSLALTPEVAARTIAGRQIMTFRAEQELRELRFDANALTLVSADLYGGALTWRREGAALVLALPHALERGAVHAVTLRYEGAPARGLVWEEEGFYTSYFTCDWMICALDRPGDAFTLALELEAPEGWRTFQAERARAYPAHVQGFAAGAWTEIVERAGETELSFLSAHASEAELSSMFAESARMLAFLEERAGVAFPHARYTQLLVRGGAAQEGAGFAIIGDDTLRPILENPHEDWVLAHEMAHAYWGNLITCADWSEFWLNEGLTTFMTAAWKERRWGAADYEREIELARRRWTAAREAGWDRPLAFSGAYPDLRTRRAIQYSKGMLFFVELRNELGEDAFWRGLSRYTRENAGRAVESADLQRAMEGASGRDLGALFAAWVYEGRPESPLP